MKRQLLACAAAILSLAAFAVPAPVAGDVDFYLIGSNVNGTVWTLASPDAKMTYQGDGVYAWDGEILGTGFKINNGTWEYDEYNIGADDQKLVIGTPYYVAIGGSSHNIAYSDVTEVLNPHVVLDTKEWTVTVTGKEEGQYKWYLTGEFNGWSFDNELIPAGNDIYKIENIEIPAVEGGTIKVTMTGWSEQYGNSYNDEVILQSDNSLICRMSTVGGDNPGVSFPYSGTFDVTWNLTDHLIVFTPVGGTPVIPDPDPIIPDPDPVPSDVDFYMIGSDVNGKAWSLAQPDAKFTYEGNGIYTWRGEYLSTSFKINDGTWEHEEYNLGASDSNTLILGEPYDLEIGYSSINIYFADYAYVRNPYVVLDTNEWTITVTGDQAEIYRWYIIGSFNGWAFDNELLPAGNGEYRLNGLVLDTAEDDTFKIAKTGWVEQYGNGNDHLETSENGIVAGYLTTDSGENFGVPFNLKGTYDVIWNLDTHIVTFIPEGVTPIIPDPVPSDVDFYMEGSDVNGKTWSLAEPDAKFTYEGNGIYTWRGEYLSTGFKINDGTWDHDEYNIGAPYNTELILGEPYQVERSGSSLNINFADYAYVRNPYIVLDTNEWTITVTGDHEEINPVPSDVDFYMIGSDVNGKNWNLAQPDAKFTYEGNGIYTWRGEYLSTGFKINDGTWENVEYNLGAPDNTALILGEPYQVERSGSSLNINFADYAYVRNPYIVLDTNEWTITVTGDPEGTYNWYITGTFNNWAFDNELLPAGNGEYRLNGLVLDTAEDNTFKITKTGWTEQYGNGSEDYLDLASDGTATGYLSSVWGDNPGVAINLKGTYDVVWNPETHIVTFTPSGVIDPENPFEDPDYAKLLVKTENGVAITNRVPQYSDAEISFTLDDYWYVSSITVNGNVISADVNNSLWITMNSDKVVIATVDYRETLEWVDSTTGAAEFEGSNLTIGVEYGSIVIAGLQGGEEIVIYNLAGQIVGSYTARETKISVNPGPGVYVVRVNDHAAKVALH